MTTVSEGMTHAQRREVIEAFARALNREAHNLRLRPDLTWQQLYNRLQWEDEPVPHVLAPELARRTAAGAARWIRTRMPFHESKALLMTFKGHAGGVNACAVSCDGSFIVSASDDKTLKIWDAVTGSERATLIGHTDAVKSCAVSPDGSFIVSGGRDKTLRIWDTASGQERNALSSFNGSVTSCAISPDGASVVSTSLSMAEWWEGGPGLVLMWPLGKILTLLREGREIKVWDLATLAQQVDLIGWFSTCALSPDGTFIVSGSEDKLLGLRKYLKIWDAATGEERAKLASHRNRKVQSWAVSPDGRFVVSADDDNTLRIWDVPTKKSRRRQRARATIVAHSEPVTWCAISPDGSFIVSASVDNTAKIWDRTRGEERATLAGHTDAVTSCAVSPDGSFIVSGSRDRSLKVWATGAREERESDLHTRRVNSCAALPDGAAVISASDDKILKIWDVAAGKERATLAGHNVPVTSCTVSPDGTFVVSGGYDRPGGFDGCLKIWDLPSGSERATLSSFSMRLYSCAVSADGTFVVSTEDDQMRIWNVPTRNKRRRQRSRAVLTGHRGHPSVPGTAVAVGTVIASNVIKACAISPDGSFLVSGGDDRTVRIWDVPRRRKWLGQKAWAILRGHTDVVACCAISPDGKWIVSGSWDNTLILDSVTGEEQRVLLGHTDRVTCCAISPDGRWFVSGSWDNTLMIWDSVTGEGRGVLLGHTDRVTCCAISLDSRFIVSGSDDQTLRIWDLGNRTELATIFLLGAPTCSVFSPSRPLVASVDAGGVYLLDVVGIEYGLPPADPPA